MIFLWNSYIFREGTERHKSLALFLTWITEKQKIASNSGDFFCAPKGIRYIRIMER